MNPTGRRAGLSLIAGAIWGFVGLACAGPMLGPVVWSGVVASPAIGLGIALMFPGFQRWPNWLRIVLSLVSLYLATGLFALAVGIASAVPPAPNLHEAARIFEVVLGVWWGLTFTGLLPLLWPLAYVTHHLVGRSESWPVGRVVPPQTGA